MIWADRIAVALLGLIVLFGLVLAWLAGRAADTWTDTYEVVRAAMLLVVVLGSVLILPAWIILRLVDWIFAGQVRKPEVVIGLVGYSVLILIFGGLVWLLKLGVDIAPATIELAKNFWHLLETDWRVSVPLTAVAALAVIIAIVRDRRAGLPWPW